METLKVWSFDGDTTEYAWPVTCYPCPETPGHFIMPDHYLEHEPPPAGPNEVVIAVGAVWEVVPDFRGQVFYDENGIEHLIDVRGQSPLPGWKTSPPQTLEQRRAAMIIKRGQGRIILHEDGLLETAEGFVNGPDCPAVVKIAYQDAADWMRLSTTTAALMQVLGLDDAQTDDMFVRAAAVEY